MPRNGKSTKSAATAVADGPNELYDTLTQDEQDTFDEIGTLGYVPEKGVTGLWLAKKRSNPDAMSVGPANDLKDLLSRVKDDINGDSEFDNDIDSSDEDETIDEPASEASDDSTPGDGYLFPGMKPTSQKSVPALVTAILNYESYKRERQDALTKEVEAKGTVVELMQKNKDALAFDPKTGIRSYRVNDYIEELVPGEEKLKSRRVSEDEE
jgi:hypothetical protein